MLTMKSKRSSDEDSLGELFGGFTAKQRLREEIESPFRKVRIFFFGASSASALLALYFSVINAGKAYVGGCASQRSSSPPAVKTYVKIVPLPCKL